MLWQLILMVFVDHRLLQGQLIYRGAIHKIISGYGLLGLKILN
jgi:hypothetical protein